MRSLILVIWNFLSNIFVCLQIKSLKILEKFIKFLLKTYIFFFLCFSIKLIFGLVILFIFILKALFGAGDLYFEEYFITWNYPDLSLITKDVMSCRAAKTLELYDWLLYGVDGLTALPLYEKNLDPISLNWYTDVLRQQVPIGVINNLYDLVTLAYNFDLGSLWQCQNYPGKISWQLSLEEIKTTLRLLFVQVSFDPAWTVDVHATKSEAYRVILLYLKSMPGSLSSEEFIDFYIKCAEVLEDIRVERNFGFEEKLSDDKISIEFQEFLYRVVEKYNYPKKIFILESYLKLISIVISWLSINNLLLVLSFFFSLKKK